MSDLKTVTNLARVQLELERQIAETEEHLKTLREQHQGVSENDIPEAMDAADIREFKLGDGRVVSIEESYHAKIPEGRRRAAFRWLRAHGHNGIIKRIIALNFGKGDDELAEAFVNWIKTKENLVDRVSDKEDVHHSTLKAFVKEMKEQGVDFPDEDFGVYVRRFAKIK